MAKQDMIVHRLDNSEDYIEACFKCGLKFHVNPHPFFRHAVMITWIDDEVDSRLNRQFALKLIRKNVIADRFVVEAIRDAMLLSGTSS